MASGVFMIRHNQQDVTFKVAATDEEYLIRAGDKIMMYPPAIHKDPEIFEHPEVSVIINQRPSIDVLFQLAEYSHEMSG